MGEKIEIKTWIYHDCRRISLFLSGKKIIAKVYRLDGSVEHKIPSYDMNLPKEIINNASETLLSRFLQDTYIHLSIRSDNSVALYINPRVNGAGFWGFIVGVISLGAGIALTVTTGPIGAVIGSGLINAGINTSVHSVGNDDFTWDYWKQALGGLASGIVMGGAGQLAGAITTPTATFTKQITERFGSIGSKIANIITNENVISCTKVGIHMVGGAGSQALSSKIIDGEVNTGKVLAGALGGAVSGVFANTGMNPENLPGNVVDNALEQEMTTGQKIFNTIAETGQKVWNNESAMPTIITSGVNQTVEFIVQKRIKQYENIINNQNQTIHTKKTKISTLKAKDKLQREQMAANTEDANQLRQEKNELDEEKKRLQEQIDAQQRRNIHTQKNELPNEGPPDKPQDSNLPNNTPLQQYPGTLYQPGLRQRKPVNPTSNNSSDEESIPAPIKRPQSK